MAASAAASLRGHAGQSGRAQTPRRHAWTTQHAHAALYTSRRHARCDVCTNACALARREAMRVAG